jgi:hypothetical protein
MHPSFESYYVNPKKALPTLNKKNRNHINSFENKNHHKKSDEIEPKRVNIAKATSYGNYYLQENIKRNNLDKNGKVIPIFGNAKI